MAKVANKPGLDPLLPDVPLTLGGIERHLCFDFNGITLAERETGLNLLTAIVSDVDATKLRALLWAALLKEHPELTIAEAGAFITPWNLGEVHAAIIAAWFGSITEAEPSAEPTSNPKREAQVRKKNA